MCEQVRWIVGKGLLMCAVAWGAWLVVDSFAKEAPLGSTPITYTLSPQSRLDVLTRKAGVLGGFGHDHRIRARSFSGTIVYDPANAAASRVEITVETRSLDVLPSGADRKDGPRVEKAMREHVLHPDRFPTITFRSRSVAPIEGGLRVTGNLTLAGQTHPVTVDVQLQAGARQLVAVGKFSIKQTDWGIEPYSAALGTIKVANEVTFELRAVAVRTTG
jgi:polyisoprenoid-binding protein YceI